jgi:hypothetical protein
MRFEGIWIQRGQRLVRWHESIHGEDKSLGDEFAADYERLYMQGHLVLLVPGKNYDLDRMFFFETAAEALSFYNSDLESFECSIGDEHEPCGFDDVSLYKDRHRIATKSCPPSIPARVSNEAAKMERHCIVSKITQQNISEE